MFIKALTLGCILFCSSFCNLSAESISLRSEEIASAAIQQQDGITIRVWIIDKWWIIEFGPDGSIINIYPDIDE